MSSDLLSLLIPLNKKYRNIYILYTMHSLPVILYSSASRHVWEWWKKQKTVLDEIRRYKMCNFMTLRFRCNYIMGLTLMNGIMHNCFGLW